MNADSTRPSLLGGLKPVMQWLILLILSVIFTSILLWPGIPAALLLGPMAAGIVLSTNGGVVKIAEPAMSFAQGLLGCMIARMLTQSITGDVSSQWPIIAAGTISVIGASSLISWWLGRMRVLPGTTVVWGLSPGAATAMIVMADDYGADTRLVAFMQYLRVIVVTIIASLISKVLGIKAAHAVHTIVWFPAITWLPFAETLAFAILGPMIARWIKFPIGALLIPLFGSMLCVHNGWMKIEEPTWLLAIGYALIGWRTGLRFTGPLLGHVARMLPAITASILALVAICGVLGLALMVFAGIDPLTAYLATSPGGADSAAIIAASTHVDASLVMSMQMARFMVVLLIGPIIARFIAKYVDPAPSTSLPSK